jgi:hypothetical protein
MERGIQDYNKDKSSKSDQTTRTYILRHFGWRKQMGATNTRIHQFTGGKSGERQNLITS